MSLAAAALRAAAAAVLALAANAGSAAPTLSWRLEAAHSHDPGAFTQGLLLYRQRLYESTGLRGRSQVRVVDPASGRVLRSRSLPDALFGEGLARVDERLYQLTWQAGRGFVYAAADLRPLGEFRYPGEGWGLAFDGRRLYMSDGSAQLRIVDPDGFVELGRVDVMDDGAPVEELNELEFAAGMLYANVWRTDRIARIDPTSGRVTGWLDLTGLLGPAGAGADVLNGIAFDEAAGTLWVTGKLWPRVFVIKVEE